MTTHAKRTYLFACCLLVMLLVQCQIADYTQYSAPAETYSGLTDNQIATLESLELLDDYPLYTMHYYGDYPENDTVLSSSAGSGDSTWACSLFAALGDPDNLLYGRNFDWEFSPGLLLFTHPADGFASVSMVDIAYLGFPDAKAQGITEMAIEKRKGLLDAPWWPFDGMNEMGLVVGMAAVPESKMPHDPTNPIIDSISVIREILDHASKIEEAIEILQSYNMDWDGGPALHYLVADASGRAVLVEFYQGEHQLFYNEQPWHQATNFLITTAGDWPEGLCHRYQTISDEMIKTSGRLDSNGALDLLGEVAQPGTQWSAVYDLSSKSVSVAMGQQYDNIHTLDLALED